MNSGLLISNWGRKLGKKLMKGPLKPKPEKGHVQKKWNIVKGDFVQVMEGPQTGQRGKILHVLRDTCRVIIEGVNLRSRNVKSKLSGLPGKKVIQPCSIHYSNVMLIDPTIGEPTKVARRFLEDGTKVRVSKKTGHIIPKPDPLADRMPRSSVVGEKDTLPAEVFKVSFKDYLKYLPYIYASENN